LDEDGGRREREVDVVNWWKNFPQSSWGVILGEELNNVCQTRQILAKLIGGAHAISILKL